MHVHRSHPMFAITSVLILAAMACSGTAAPTETATPAPSPTETPRPTATPRPTKTPDLAATEQYGEFYSLLDGFKEAGYIDSTEGSVEVLPPFSESWAQMFWYQFWPVTSTTGDFVFKGHLEWSHASNTPEESGCGIIFGAQPNQDHYAVFLTSNRILFLMARGSNTYEVGKTSGSGRVDFGNPGEADMAVVVQGQGAYVSVNGEVTRYTLSQDQTTQGEFAYSLLSGTNKDYGTRCKMTDLMFWSAR